MKTFVKSVIAAGIVLDGPGLALAQTSSRTLTITATVTSSIALTFENDAAGGGTHRSGHQRRHHGAREHFRVGNHGVTRTVGTSDFTVSSPFGERVNKANSLSTTYTLAAALASADPTNTWVIDAVMPSAISPPARTPWK